jgi:hypothetical protein
LLFAVPSCKQAKRYEYQQIKQAYENPKAPAAGLSSSTSTQPVETPEK